MNIPDVPGPLVAPLQRFIGQLSDARGGTDRFGYDPADIETRADVNEKLGLTTREFVERLLVEHGGRLEQQSLTEYTNWSQPLVSQVLRELEDEDAVVRLRVGREKLVCLPAKVREIDQEHHVSE